MYLYIYIFTYLFICGGSDIDAAVGTVNARAKPFVHTLSVKGMGALTDAANRLLGVHGVLAYRTILGRGGLELKHYRVCANVCGAWGHIDGFHEGLVSAAKEGGHQICNPAPSIRSCRLIHK